MVQVLEGRNWRSLNAASVMLASPYTMASGFALVGDLDATHVEVVTLYVNQPTGTKRSIPRRSHDAGIFRRWRMGQHPGLCGPLEKVSLEFVGQHDLMARAGSGARPLGLQRLEAGGEMPNLGIKFGDLVGLVALKLGHAPEALMWQRLVSATMKPDREETPLARWRRALGRRRRGSNARRGRAGISSCPT